MPRLHPDAEMAVREVLGYLNFSSGGPDSAFQRQINSLHGYLKTDRPWEPLRKLLTDSLAELRATGSAAFANTEQAEAVISLVFDDVLPAYRMHHSDLLLHLADTDFEQPFFLVRVFEAVLKQGPPWNERERIVAASLNELNDFIGHRPVGVLNDGRRMEAYPHERFRPVPLYIQGSGVAEGPYKELIEQTLAVLAETDPTLRRSAHFDLSLLDELALDVRAHDHLHPANKRTNYLFGEWDPHQIDVQGRYRRYVIRKVVIDALLDWIAANPSVPREELLYDAAALLGGTMLMASTISGSGPDTHDSNVTLTSLLPRVAGLREEYYAHLMEKASGPRLNRLVREAKKTQQPFGHVRQHVNVYVAQYGSRQVQHRELAHLFAQIGYPEASRQQAMAIPAVSIRFECEIQWRLRASHIQLDAGHVTDAIRLLAEAEEFLHRGIECGGIVDPWNILAFQGNFPLFSSREDAVPDQRAEWLVETIDRFFDLHSRILGELATRHETAMIREANDRFRCLADFWDRFATTTVSDISNVNGQERWQSAMAVAGALSEWKTAGQASGDISFWREHIDQFGSDKAFALIVETLLQKQDYVAAMGLLIGWLSKADEVGLGEEDSSIYPMFLQWMRLVAAFPRDAQGNADYWSTVRRMFDYLEANAGSHWSVPRNITGTEDSKSAAEPNWDVDDSLDAVDDKWDDSDDNMFSAAYEDVVFRDSAEDGVFGDTMDFSQGAGNTEFEMIERILEPRLRFLHMVSELWQIAAAEWMSRLQPSCESPESNHGPEGLETESTLGDWLERTQVLQQDLSRLMEELWNRPIADTAGDQESVAEYDIQLQTKLHVTQATIATSVNCRMAERFLRCCLPEGTGKKAGSAEEKELSKLYRAMFRGDAAETTRILPAYLKKVSKSPLLYVPLERGGSPRSILGVRHRQAAIRFLLAQLPNLGLLRDTALVLETARSMERFARPSGIPVTEFDRLFRVALRHSVEAVMRASRNSEDSAGTDPELIDIVPQIVDHYDKQWQAHARTMRISTVEAFRSDQVWQEVKEFVTNYGADLFHVKLLTLGNVRTALHKGTEYFLAMLSQQQDPLHTIRLIDDLECKRIDTAHAAHMLDLIYSAIIERFERFLEYNTTTAQSDYGEMLYCLLDMMRVESDYDRDAWRFTPITEAHAVLAREGNFRLATAWAELFAPKAKSQGQRYIKRLHTLERKYGMRLPAMADRLNECFVKPLAVDRMIALVQPAMQDARDGTSPSSAFRRLRSEIEEYLATSTGSGVDVPFWLRRLEEEVHTSDLPGAEDREAPLNRVSVPIVPLSLADVQRELDQWRPPATKPRKKKKQ